MSALTIITPTGERPEAFALCRRQMKRQTFKGPVYWIIVDDGKAPLDVDFKKQGWTIKTIRPEPFWNPGDNTQARNLIAGLDEAERHANATGRPLRLTVWEDDDWYHPDWLEKISIELPKAELVGEGLAHYFNVSSRRHNPLRNYKHASLRCSAMRDGAIDRFREILGTFSMYYDFKLWKAHENKRVFHSNLTIGIKGMPGRPGIAVGHDPQKGRHDPEMKKLREWIGADADWYIDFYKEPLMAQSNTTKRMRALQRFKYGERGWIEKDEIFELRSNQEEALFVGCGRAEPTADEAPAPAPKRKKAKRLSVQNQEENLVDQIVEKTQPDEKKEADAVTEEDKSEPKKTLGFGRGRKSAASKKDD